MATVPKFNQPSVEQSRVTTQFQTGGASAASFGGQEAQGLGALSQGVDKVRANFEAEAIKQKKLDQVAEITNSKSSLAKWEESSLFGDGGFYSKRGESARGGTGAVMEDYDKVSGELINSLQDPQQRLVMSQVVESRRRQIFKSVNDHDRKETENWRKSSMENGAALAVKRAAMNFNDPEVLASSETEIKRTIRAGMFGEDPAIVSAKVDGAVSDMHKAVLDRLIATDPAGAQKYYEEKKKAIDPLSHTQIENSIETNGSIRSAQEFADVIGVYHQGDEQKQLSEARAQLNGKAEAEAVAEIKGRFAEARRIEKETYNAKLEEASLSLESARKLSDVPNYADLSAGDRAAIRKTFNDARAGKNVTPDFIRLQELEVMAVRQPEKFKALNLTKEMPRLGSSAEFKDIMKLQTNLKKGNTKGYSQLQTKTQVLSTAAKAMGIDKNADKMAELSQRVQMSINATQDEKGRAPNDQEINTIINQMAMEIEIDDGGFLGINFRDPDINVFELEGDEVIVVPSEDKRLISESLKRNGHAVTDANIQKLYKIKLGL